MSDNNLAPWIKWVAQDKNGAIWGFEAEPHLHEYGWYENEVGRYILLVQAEKSENWENSLTPIDNLKQSSFATLLNL